MGEYNQKAELIELLWIIIIGVIMSLLLPIVFGFAFGGFELGEFFEKFRTYVGIGLAGFLLLIGLKGLEIVTKGRGADCITHDPDSDYAVLGKLSFVRNRWKLLLISIILFSFLGMFSAISNTFYTGVPQIVAQQVSPVARLYYSAEPPAWTETILAIAVASLILTLFKRFVYKNKEMPVFMSFIVVMMTTTLFWFGLHQLAYGGQEIALMSVLFFGMVGGFLTTATGSFIPWYIWHFFNNLYYALNKTYSNELIIVWTIIFNIVFLAITFMILLKKKGGVKIEQNA